MKFFYRKMSSSDSDELDVLSASFNPIKALYSDNVKLPDVAASALDNISRFELTPEEQVVIKPLRPRVIENCTTDID